jgi:CRISPR-associated protein Csm5
MIKDYLETKKFVMKCMSPVHIGNGDVPLKSFQYMYDEQHNKVYFLDEHKWSIFLFKRQLTDAFAKAIMEPRGINALEWIMSRPGITRQDILEVTNGYANTPINIKKNKYTLNDIVRTSCQSDGQPYIPGSSIKGALRTGIIFKWLKLNPDEAQTYWKEIDVRRNLPSKALKQELNNIVVKIEKKALGEEPIVETGKKGRKIASGLKVSDGICKNRVTTIVVPKLDGHTNEPRPKSISVFREALPTGTEVEFYITMERDLLKQGGIETIDELLMAQLEFLKLGWDYQKTAFRYYEKELLEAENADLVLGGGTGFLTKSLLLALAPNKAAAKYTIASILNSIFGKHIDKEISPRTLKLTKERQQMQLMGLCQLQEVNV